MSQVSVQSRPTTATAGWGPHHNSLSTSGQAEHMASLDATPWQQSPAPQWGTPGLQAGMPTLRAIMHEEQQAAVQARSAASHSAGSTDAPRSNGAGGARNGGSSQNPPPIIMAHQHPAHVQSQHQHLMQQQQLQPPQQQQQQQQQAQRSGGFYLRNTRDDSVPVKGSWAQALSHQPVDGPSNPLGMSSLGNGMVDLQMATEAFRDAFSATAPPMEGPSDGEQDPLLAEAYRSPAHPITGKVHCLACGKAFKEHIILAQHLKDKHQGRNLAEVASARGNLTLGDIMAQAQAKRAAAPAKTGPAERHQKQYSAFIPGDSRGMREYLKRFPNKASLAMAVHKELGGSHTKKKMSRLKRIILRERADKAASQASTAAELASEGLIKSKSALESLQRQLKEAEEQLDEGKVGFIPEASALTHKQVLEMAVAEASRRVHEATKQVTDAEEEATSKAEERAKVWKTQIGSNSTSPNSTPNTSVEIVPKDSKAAGRNQADQAASSSLQAERSHSADELAATKAQRRPSADDQYVSEQLQLMGLSLNHEPEQHADEQCDSEAGSSESDEEERGLEAFEDVLSSWLTAAHSKTSQALMKAQASLPLRPRTAGNPSSGQSTLARIQEQQQQLAQEEAKASGEGEGLQPTGKKIKCTRGKQAAESAHAESAALHEEEEQDVPDSPTGIEGWKDVMSGWIDTAGAAAPPPHAQQAHSEPAAQAGGKVSRSKAPHSGSATAAPGWLADVSSDDEDDEEEEQKDSILPPRTSSISESQLNTAVSQEHVSDNERQTSQPAAASLTAADQQQPQHAQHGGVAHAPFPPSPLQGYSVPFDTVMSTSGISSQDRKLEGDLLSRARSDPAALWPNPALGFPPRLGAEQHGLPAVATSVPAPVYLADQGLPPQALQNWKEQFKGLYRSFGADQPGPAFPPLPNPAFAGQRFEPPPGSSANSHEFECAVCNVTCCGIINFEQHCTSKKHLRKAAAVAHATVSSNSLFLAGNDATPTATASTASDGGNGTTYVGIKAQCRTYCKQVISAELNRVVVELLQQLLFWQERQKAQDPLKATKKKRLVSGLREVAKAVKLRKAKTVVVAPNIEQIESEGGLDDLLGSILRQAEDFGLPVVFALSRKKMGQVFGCRKKMSAIAILDYGGANELFNQMSALAKKGRVDYMLYYNEDESNVPSEMDPMALTRSDSDSSSTFGQEGPVLYRLRADGRKVPITDGQGMDLARRKGLTQEVVVSPKRASQLLPDGTSAFGPQLSQPETVVLHSVGLPQVQLGDREIADSPPELAGDEVGLQEGEAVRKAFNLHSHPSLLRLSQQQQQQQSQTNSLMSACGLEPRSNSEVVGHSSQASQGAGSITHSSSMSRIGSMNGLAPEVATAREMAGNPSGTLTSSVPAAAQQPGYMQYWGPANHSAPLPNHAAPPRGASGSPFLGRPPAGGPYGGAAVVGEPFAQSGAAALQREALSRASLQHLAKSSQSFGARPPGPAGSAFPATPQDGGWTPGGSMYRGNVGAQIPHFGGNRLPNGEVAGGQGFGALHAAPGSVGRGISSGPGPAQHGILAPNALGPADPSVLFDGQHGFGGKPVPPPATALGYGAAYAPSGQYMAYGAPAAYPGHPVGAPPPLSHPWQQPQPGGWPLPAPHMNPYQPSVRGMLPPYYHQQQHMLNDNPRQLNAHAQEWKPHWA